MDAEPEAGVRGGPSVASDVRKLAEAALVGVPIAELLRTEDEDERELLWAVADEGREVLDVILTNLARKIVSEYAEAQKRGK